MNIRMVLMISAAGALVSACNGWPDSHPAEEAENRPEKFPTYAATAAESASTFTFDNRRWMVSASPVSLRGAKLQAVGTGGTASLYAPEGDVAPYSILYTPDGSKWRQVLPIE
jgi:hypothetical protein